MMIYFNKGDLDEFVIAMTCADNIVAERGDEQVMTEVLVTALMVGEEVEVGE